jgi:hypothetical protein
MTMQRMDNVLIVVDDLEGARAFFAELGELHPGLHPVRQKHCVAPGSLPSAVFLAPGGGIPGRRERGGGLLRRDRQGERDVGPVRRGGDLELAVEHRGAFAHAGQDVSAVRVPGIEAAPVVADVDAHDPATTSDRDLRACRGRVTLDVRQRLLHDPVDGRLHRCRQTALAEPDVRPRVQARALGDASDEAFDRGRQAELVERGGTQLADQLAQTGDLAFQALDIAGSGLDSAWRCQLESSSKRKRTATPGRSAWSSTYTLSATCAITGSPIADRERRRILDAGREAMT